MLKELNGSNFEEEVLKAEGLVMVDFWAVWCSPCRALSPIVESVATEMDSVVKVCKYDVESDADIPSRYGVMSIPALLFFKNGELVDKSIGLVSKAKLVEKINSLL
ncbi:MAG: thioredoxin [Bacteroidales bacterium]|nr:thioredoxin [Bacteroidales bacterium]